MYTQALYNTLLTKILPIAANAEKNIFDHIKWEGNRSLSRSSKLIEGVLTWGFSPKKEYPLEIIDDLIKDDTVLGHLIISSARTEINPIPVTRVMGDDLVTLIHSLMRHFPDRLITSTEGFTETQIENLQRLHAKLTGTKPESKTETQSEMNSADTLDTQHVASNNEAREIKSQDGPNWTEDLGAEYSSIIKNILKYMNKFNDEERAKFLPFDIGRQVGILYGEDITLPPGGCDSHDNELNYVFVAMNKTYHNDVMVNKTIPITQVTTYAKMRDAWVEEFLVGLHETRPQRRGRDRDRDSHDNGDRRRKLNIVGQNTRPRRHEDA